MHSAPKQSLELCNAFSVSCYSSNILTPSTIAELVEISEQLSRPFYILGEGYNTLFADKQAPLIIKPNFNGIEIKQTPEHYFITVGASENWHELVCLCVEKGINGLENLALIPGSVGAAPIQNIGAYGAEFADFCQQIDWFDFNKKQLVSMSKAQCQFAYRESIFKGQLKEKGIITAVTLRIPKIWQRKLSYQGLDKLPSEVSAKDIMAQVITLRQAKLPDPEVLPNAGSFFKNPIVNKSISNALLAQYPEMPIYPINGFQVKLAAGWLIEQTGLKGYQQNGVGVHKQQALVLVNYNSKQGEDIVVLAQYVQQQVRQKFNIVLEPEVRIVLCDGEQAMKSLH